MRRLITSKKLKAVFRINKLDSIKSVCGFDMKGYSSKFDLFDITLYEVRGNRPKLKDKMEFLQKIIPILIDKIKNKNECVIQLFGQLAPGELPDVYPYIFTSGANNRYYCPELINKNAKKCYIESWVSFEFDKSKISEMPLQADIIIKGFIVDKSIPDIFNTFFKTEWKKGTIETLLKRSLIYFETDFDFEYFSVASKIPMKEIISKWQEGLDFYDQGNN